MQQKFDHLNLKGNEKNVSWYAPSEFKIFKDQVIKNLTYRSFNQESGIFPIIETILLTTVARIYNLDKIIKKRYFIGTRNAIYQIKSLNMSR